MLGQYVLIDKLRTFMVAEGLAGTSVGFCGGIHMSSKNSKLWTRLGSPSPEEVAHILGCRTAALEYSFHLCFVGQVVTTFAGCNQRRRRLSGTAIVASGTCTRPGIQCPWHSLLAPEASKTHRAMPRRAAKAMPGKCSMSGGTPANSATTTVPYEANMVLWQRQKHNDTWEDFARWVQRAAEEAYQNWLIADSTADSFDYSWPCDDSTEPQLTDYRILFAFCEDPESSAAMLMWKKRKPHGSWCAVRRFLLRTSSALVRCLPLPLPSVRAARRLPDRVA